MGEEEMRCFCAVMGQEIGAWDCFDAALVFEGMSPRSELPPEMEFSEENRARCLKCAYHPT